MVMLCRPGSQPSSCAARWLPADGLSSLYDATSWPRVPGKLVISAAAQGGYLRSREQGMVIVPPHVQVVIWPLVLCSQAVSIRCATGCQ